MKFEFLVTYFSNNNFLIGKRDMSWNRKLMFLFHSVIYWNNCCIYRSSCRAGHGSREYRNVCSCYWKSGYLKLSTIIFMRKMLHVLSFSLYFSLHFDEIFPYRSKKEYIFMGGSFGLRKLKFLKCDSNIRIQVDWKLKIELGRAWGHTSPHPLLFPLSLFPSL